MQTEFLADALKGWGRRLDLAAGQTLFGEGQSDARVFLVESGSIEIGIGSKEGQRLTLNVLRPGEVFGEIAMLDGGPRTADAFARVDSRVRSLDREGFFALFPSREEGYELAVRLLCGRLRWINRQTERDSLCTARSRLASRLLMMEEEGSGDWIRTSQQAIADRAGLTREYVNRLLGEWAAAGAIECRRGAVRIVCRETLIELTDAAA